MGILSGAPAPRLASSSRWDTDLRKLSTSQHDAIGDPENQIFVSAITAWELGIKHAAGKLTLTASIRSLALRFGFTELSITAAHGEAAAALPLHHKDPFDRMLIAQAITEQMTLVSADARFASYAGLQLLP